MSHTSFFTWTFSILNKNSVLFHSIKKKHTQIPERNDGQASPGVKVTSSKS